MKFSLLYKTEDKPAVCQILYDLSVDRAVHNLVSDRRRAEYFLSVLEKPLTNRENITFRQEIFTDLVTIPGLAESLKTLFNRYDRIKIDWQEMKLGAVPSRGAEINHEALLEHTFSSLKVTAIFPSTIASFFTSISHPFGGAYLHAGLVSRDGRKCRPEGAGGDLAAFPLSDPRQL